MRRRLPRDDILREMPTRALTPSEAAVLGFLASGREISGYDLKKRTEKSVGYFWTPARSQIYQLLPKLVENGFATRREVVQTQRPDKQLYRITPLGRRALREWLETPAGEEPSRNPFLIKVFFGEHADSESLLDQIRAFRRRAEELDAVLTAIDEATPPDGDFFPELTRRYGHEHARALIRWARAAERDLEARSSRRRARAEG